jgi:hypothetical protein
MEVSEEVANHNAHCNWPQKGHNGHAGRHVIPTLCPPEFKLSQPGKTVRLAE